MKSIPQEIWDELKLAEHALNGAWPNGGGTLNETESFLDLVNLYRVEKNKHE